MNIVTYCLVAPAAAAVVTVASERASVVVAAAASSAGPADRPSVASEIEPVARGSSAAVS